MAKDDRLSVDQFEELVTLVGGYLEERQQQQLGRKAVFAGTVLFVGGMYTGAMLHRKYTIKRVKEYFKQ